MNWSFFVIPLFGYQNPNDRGKTWENPCRFNNVLNDDPNLKGLEITSRTSRLGIIV